LARHSLDLPCGSRVAVVCLILGICSIAQAPGAQPSSPPSPAERVRFIREFSSAQDVRRPHPVLNKTLDIIAGSKPIENPVEVLKTPFAVTTDSWHRIFVTDTGLGKVHIFDFDHSRYFTLGNSREGLGRPAGIAADRENNVYVTDSNSGAIRVFDSKGKFRRYLKESRGSESYFQQPLGIAVDTATERIYVCDSSRHMIIVLDKKGRVIDRFGKRNGGARPGEFRYPTQLVVSGGEITVLDSGNRRVQILDSRGHFQREIQLGYADKDSGLAADADGKIYVSDSTVNQVRVFSHDGGLLYRIGHMGTQAGEFDGASGLWLDSGNCLYVVDARNKRVQEFQVAGPGAITCP